MELSAKARELIIALARELMTEDEVVSLVGDGQRRVASHAGVKTFGQPIGTVITPDMEIAAKEAKRAAEVAPRGSLGQAPANVNALGKNALAAAGDKSSGKGAGAKPVPVKKAVHVHPRVPGAKVYEFDDGTVVVEDPTGRRTEPKKVNVQQLFDLGWKTHGDGPTAQDDIDAEERTNKAKTKVKSLASPNHSKYTEHLDKFNDDGDRINEVMRKGEDHGEHIETINGLRNFLKDSKTKEHMTVHRGMTFANAQDRDVYVQQVLRPGNRFKDKGFVTASAHPDTAAQHADSGGVDSSGVIMNIDVPKGSRAAAMRGGDDDPDHEVLMGDGGEFIVKDVEQDEKGRYVAHLTFIDHLSGKSAAERLADESKTPDRVKERRRQQRFAWKPDSITITGKDGKPIALDTTQQPGTQQQPKGGGGNAPKRGGTSQNPRGNPGTGR